MQKKKTEDKSFELQDSAATQAEIDSPQEASRKKYSPAMETALQAVERMDKDNLH